MNYRPTLSITVLFIVTLLSPLFSVQEDFEKFINLQDGQNGAGNTALVYACLYGHFDVAKIMIKEYDAEIILRDENGKPIKQNTPLHAAFYGIIATPDPERRTSYSKIITKLIERDESILTTNNQDRIAPFALLIREYITTKNKFTIKDQLNPLTMVLSNDIINQYLLHNMFAILQYTIELPREFISILQDPKKTFNSEAYKLWVEHSLDIIEIFLPKTSDFTAKNSNYDTFLHILIRTINNHNQKEILNFLIALNNKILTPLLNIKNNLQQTPLDIANNIQECSKEIKRILTPEPQKSPNKPSTPAKPTAPTGTSTFSKNLTPTAIPLPDPSFILNAINSSNTNALQKFINAHPTEVLRTKVTFNASQQTVAWHIFNQEKFKDLRQFVAEKLKDNLNSVDEDTKTKVFEYYPNLNPAQQKSELLLKAIDLLIAKIKQKDISPNTSGDTALHELIGLLAPSNPLAIRIQAKDAIAKLTLDQVALFLPVSAANGDTPLDTAVKQYTNYGSSEQWDFLKNFIIMITSPYLNTPGSKELLPIHIIMINDQDSLLAKEDFIPENVNEQDPTTGNTFIHKLLNIDNASETEKKKLRTPIGHIIEYNATHRREIDATRIMQNTAGNTPLHIALKNNFEIQVIEKLFLLEILNTSNNDGDYPIHLLMKQPKPSKDIFDFFINQNSIIAVQTDKQGNTPAHLYVLNNQDSNSQKISYFVLTLRKTAYKVDGSQTTSITNKQNKTPVELASERDKQNPQSTIKYELAISQMA